MGLDLLKLFGLKNGSSSESLEHGSLFTRLSELLSGLSEREVAVITGISGLLGQVAYADLEISDKEICKIKSVLQSNLGLDEQHAELVVTVTKELTRELAGIEDFRYTRLINEHCTKDEKMQLLKALFEIASADDSISSDEDLAIGNIARDLLLTREDFISARADYTRFLDVIKNLPKKDTG
ncbi:MAG: TerB family tellurite resistance protein [Candidatus Dadabacteria bacterium]|nr:MAG: TerB family tellurite resistance protein [Candidatus Dadabacteria bacterium]